MKKIKRKKINHLFAKMMVIWCVLWGTACSVYALCILSRTGYDAADLLGIILAFLGGELAMMCLRTILSENTTPKDQNDMTDDEYNTEGNDGSDNDN